MEDTAVTANLLNNLFMVHKVQFSLKFQTCLLVLIIFIYCLRFWIVLYPNHHPGLKGRIVLFKNIIYIK